MIKYTFKGFQNIVTHNSMNHDFRIMSHIWNNIENLIFVIFGLERHHMIT